MVKQIMKKTKLDPAIIMMDFEAAAILTFPNALIKGCYFHFCQCLWSNIKKIGLSIPYKVTNSDKYNWLQWFKGLAFVPVTLVPNCLQYLKVNKPNQDEYLILINKFIEYFVNTWIDGQFPVTMWNHYDSLEKGEPRTNNNMEGYNRYLNEFATSTKQSFYSCEERAFVSLEHV